MLPNRSPFSVDVPHAADSSYLLRAYGQRVPHLRFRLMLFVLLLGGAGFGFWRWRSIPYNSFPQPNLAHTSENYLGAQVKQVSRDPIDNPRYEQTLKTSISGISGSQMLEIPHVTEENARLYCAFTRYLDVCYSLCESGLYSTICTSYEAPHTVFAAVGAPSMEETRKRYEVQVQELTQDFHFTLEQSDLIRAEIHPLYQQWKIEHKKSPLQIYNFISLYALDAKVSYADGKGIGLEKLALLARGVRETKSCIDISDLSPEDRLERTIWGTSDEHPTQVVLKANLDYYDADYQATSGQRILVWEKRGNGWKIVRDIFPPYMIRIEKPRAFNLRNQYISDYLVDSATD